MSWHRDVFTVALADVRERSRTSKLVLIPVVLAYFAKLVTVDSLLVIGDAYTGVPTSAWYAGLVAGIGTTVLLLFGYPLVSDSIDRDRTTNVAELVATAPLSNSSYIVGKWVSNLALLAVVTALLFGATAASFLLQGTGSFDPIAMAAPFVLLTLPTMAVVAAAGVCFETLRPLRGTGGTALYFLLALAGIIISVPPQPPLDLTGLAFLRQSMASSITAQYPSFEGPIAAFAYTNSEAGLRTFRWSGLSLDPALASRLPILGIAGGLLGVSVLSFNRFDETQTWSLGILQGDQSSAEGESNSSLDQAANPLSSDPDGDVSLAPMTANGFRLRQAFIAEFKMAVRGQRRLWYVGWIATLVGTAVVPFDDLQSLVVPVALLLPLPVWSQLGAREQIHRTEELVFANSDPLRLLAVSYLVSVGIGWSVIGPALVRYVLAGSVAGLLSAVTAVLFLPAAALALGVWSGRPSLFEVGYLAAWYLGPMNGLELLDYADATQVSSSITLQIAYLVGATVAIAIAVIGRKRQVT
jgi:ABC-type transport system involved in multi-copper enzyme maturation permease subunit